jgi:short-subunit dehydrogenase
MALPTPTDRSTALITGASSGIGAEIARELARRGHGVTLVARREDRLQALADDLSAQHGVRADVIGADLSDAAARAGIAPRIEERGLTVDVLVNNAGFTTMGPVRRADRDLELHLVRTNVEAVVDLCTTFVAGMTTRRRGAVLNTASTAAFQPLPAQASYGASKAFVLSYSQALGAELARTGVTVTALCPGPVKTGFAESAGMSDEEAGNSLPSIMWVQADVVAKAAVDGMAAGRKVVIPGLANVAGAVAGHLAPRGVILPFIVRRHPAL